MEHRMHRKKSWTGRLSRFGTLTALNLAIATAVTAQMGTAQSVQAQSGAPNAQTREFTLRSAFEAAWAQQPESQALASRRDAARAQANAARSLTPEPVAMELSTKTDRLRRNVGSREQEVGVAIPLWLPGERSRSQTLAEAEGRFVESRANAAELRVAATVREAWWSWQRARSDLDVARGQFESVRRVADDVTKRLKAGDLARADQHQADGAVAAAESAVAQANSALTAAKQQLRALTAMPYLVLVDDALPPAEPEPTSSAATPTVGVDSHAELLALKDRAAVAEGTVALAAAQSRANPEVALAATRERGTLGEPYQQTFTLGVRIPFGAGARHQARVASARAEAMELQAQIAQERARLASERESARARTEAARTQLAAADHRAQLAIESRSFFDKSFKLGETDLPTRLRIEAEAADAQRQASRARIELSAAISAWRQALGLLPE
jgi:outer membrane protein, heavy metal efflux system